MEILPLDYHIHTVYSGHSTPDMTVRNIVKQAELLGLNSIVVLEHAFYSLMGRACLEQIRKETNSIESEIGVLVGMEIDPDHTQKGKLIFKEFGRDEIDVILVGTHTIPGTDKGWYAKIKLTRKEKEMIYHLWFETMEAVLKESCVDVIAHPGRLISQNGIVENFSEKVMKDFEYLFKIAKKRNVAVELNESFLKMLKNEDRLKSYIEVVRLALSTGLKISIGSDAHSLDKIGEMSLALQIIKQLKVSEADIFFKRNKRVKIGGKK